LGCPVSAYPEGDDRPNYFTDGLRPTITLVSPRRHGSFNEIRFGCYDRNLDRSKLSVKANWPIVGRAPGSELASLFTEKDWVWSMPLSVEDRPKNGILTVTAWDTQGNRHVVERSFTNDGSTDPDPDPEP